MYETLTIAASLRRNQAAVCSGTWKIFAPYFAGPSGKAIATRGSTEAKRPVMLYTIALILAILLIFSALASYPAESEVHNLLVVAILAALIRGIQAKGAVL